VKAAAKGRKAVVNPFLTDINALKRYLHKSRNETACSERLA